LADLQGKECNRLSDAWASVFVQALYEVVCLVERKTTACMMETVERRQFRHEYELWADM
jgi:nitroimidazol reductase NimA-like FMN-containing flavoprotein (pyridoxamine 5'-phosphate oxidase superfamily)